MLTQKCQGNLGFDIFVMENKGAGNQTTVLPIGRSPALPAEPQLTLIKLTI